MAYVKYAAQLRSVGFDWGSRKASHGWALPSDSLVNMNSHLSGLSWSDVSCYHSLRLLWGEEELQFCHCIELEWAECNKYLIFDMGSLTKNVLFRNLAHKHTVIFLSFWEIRNWQNPKGTPLKPQKVFVYLPISIGLARRLFRDLLAKI